MKKPLKSTRSRLPSYITRDGSRIRELMHPDSHGCRKQSLAEAAVEPGQSTILHRHRQSEELYHIVQGRGVMTLDQDSFTVLPGDTVAIAPGTLHKISNPGPDLLVFLCCCAPPYSHDDTETMERNSLHGQSKLP